jgi:hypothetical protein
MSRPRFLADEDLRYSIVKAVRQLEPTLEIRTVIEEGQSSATDADVLEYAWQHSWIVVSHDVSTMKAAAEERLQAGEHIHGLFLAAQSRRTRVITDSLILIWSASEFAEWQDRIVYLPL